MKNILVLDTGKEWGGGTNSLLELLRRRDRDRFRFTALFYHNYNKPEESDIKTETEKLGIDFLLLERREQTFCVKILKELSRLLFSFSPDLKKKVIFQIDLFFRIRPDAARISKLLKELKTDLLYMNNQPSSNLEGILAAKETGIKALLHSRIVASLNTYEVQAVNKWLNSIICVSDGVRDSLIRQGVEGSKCIMVHNGIDTATAPGTPAETIRAELGVKDGELLICAAGSLIKRKRFRDLLDSAAGLIRDNSFENIKCIIIGHGPERDSLQKKIGSFGLQNRVTLAGFKSNAVDYLNACDIFVLPSEKEGLPRVILESMLMGKPVVAAAVPGTTELVVHRETGLLYQTGNTKELTACLTELLSSPSLRECMGAAGRSIIIEHFSIEMYVNKVSEILSGAGA